MGGISAVVHVVAVVQVVADALRPVLVPSFQLPEGTACLKVTGLVAASDITLSSVIERALL